MRFRNIPCLELAYLLPTTKMRFLLFLSAGVLAPTISSAAPVAHDDALIKRENLCNLKAPPALCQPDPSVTVEETAQRAYDFYRAFVVDGDPRKMFSLIDSTYTVSHYFSSNTYISCITSRLALVLIIECSITATPSRVRVWAQQYLGYFLQWK